MIPSPCHNDSLDGLSLKLDDQLVIYYTEEMYNGNIFLVRYTVGRVVGTRYSRLLF